MSFIELSGKTVNRSFRIDEALDAELEREAHRNNVPVSTLLLQIVNTHLNFHRYNQNRNFINIGNNTLMSLLEGVDEKWLYECGFEMGKENPASRVFKAGMRPSKDSLMIYLQTLDSYANWFFCEQKEINEKEYIYVEHNHGPLWCRFLEGYFKGIFEKLDLVADITQLGECFLIYVK
jgi:hypothetical protein